MTAREQFDFVSATGVESAILLTPEEIAAVTGYKKPALQVQELRAQGFFRARRNVLNRVVLERAHYEAVCAAAAASSTAAGERPQVASPFSTQRR